jgi:hypothetical protein
MNDHRNTTAAMSRLGALDEGQQEDGRYCLLAKSCGHFIVAFADTRKEAWAAASKMAMKLTRKGLRLPPVF